MPSISPPADLYSLLGGRPGGVNSKAFAREWGNNAYTRVRGFNEVLEACSLKGGFKSVEHAFQAVRSACPDALAAVPAQWRQTYRQGAWDECHPDQVTYARDRKALLFDKACIVLLALEIACRRDVYPALHKFYPYDFIKLEPAIYVLRGLERWNLLCAQFPKRMTDDEKRFKGELRGHLFQVEVRDIEVATDGKADALISEALMGRPMTWRNACLFAEAFAKPLFGKARPESDCQPESVFAEIAEDRSDGGRLKEKFCNQSEGPFVGLDETTRRSLRQFFERGAKKVRAS